MRRVLAGKWKNWDAGNDLHLDLGGYMGVCVCGKSYCKVKIVHFQLF